MVGHITLIPGPDVPRPSLGKTPFEITGSFFRGKTENDLTQRTHLESKHITALRKQSMFFKEISYIELHFITSFSELLHNHFGAILMMQASLLNVSSKYGKHHYEKSFHICWEPV